MKPLPNEPIIRIEDLHFTYPGDTEETLRGLSLDIAEGSFVAVLGHNGSGKSTLAKLLNAILLPTSGHVYVAGVDTADEERLLEVRGTVGLVFQNPDNQIVANVVEDDVAFAPENLGVESAEIRRRVDDALKTVGMYEYRLHAPHLLSGGQKQRVAIAGVLAMQPRCIVLDEPTAALDPIAEMEVYEKFNEIVGDRTAVYISHRLSSCRFCDEIMVFDRGQIVQKGSHDALISDEQGKYATLWHAQAQYYTEEEAASF